MAPFFFQFIRRIFMGIKIEDSNWDCKNKTKTIK